MPRQLPVLYSFRRCPYAMRARLALRYAGIRCELREVVLRDKPAALLEASPKGTVPVLVLAGDTGSAVIDESLDIMRWALQQNDPEGWLEGDRYDAERLIEANDQDFKMWLDRYKYPDRYRADDAGMPVGLAARAECERFLRMIESRLAGSLWLGGSKPRLADMAILPFVRQFAHTDIEWFRGNTCPAVNQWLSRLLGGELFQAIMAKYPPWQPGDPVTVFN